MKKKLYFMLLSVFFVAISLMGDIITRLSLFYFESFYVYIVMMIIAFVFTLNKKNPNILIIISLFTYLWTIYLVVQMIEAIPEINIQIFFNFYIYLISSIFLFISLFLMIKKLRKII